MQRDKRNKFIGLAGVFILVNSAFFFNSQLYRPMRQLDQTAYAKMLFDNKQYSRIDTRVLTDETAELLLSTYFDKNKVNTLLSTHAPKEALRILIESEVAK